MKSVEEIDVLISRFLSGEATPGEAIELIDWRDLSPENEAYFERSASAFGWTELNLDLDESWDRLKTAIEPEEKKVRTMRFHWSRIAAAALVVIVLGIGLKWYFDQRERENVLTASATKQSWTLDDGTKVDAKPHSEVELADGFGKTNRRLKLRGSGYFTVDHNEQLPFVIETGPIHIKDLGTKFDVQNSGDTIFIRVDEGSVLIYDNKGLRLTVEAGSEAYYVISAGNLQLVGKANTASVVKTFVFDNQRLETVIAQLKQVYKVDVRLANNDLANCRITTRFSDETIEVVLAIVTETLGLQLEDKGDYYFISGSSCN